MSTRVTSELDGIVNLIRDCKAQPLMPLFEAIVNSIQAIEERFSGKVENGIITIRIRRDQQQCLQFDESSRREPDIVGFEIEDNGIGFTNENLESFKVVATRKKATKGGKGLGRFTWLKAFEQVHIDSVFEDGSGTKKRRRIAFSLEKGIVPSPIEDTDPSENIRTIVSLERFKKSYRSLQAAYKTSDKIAQRVLEHCLVAFLNNCAPSIVVDDADKVDSTPINLKTLFDSDILPHISRSSFTIKQENFTVIDLKLYGTHAQMHNMSLCANSREVQSIEIGKELGTSAQFDDNGKKFIYSVYVTGAYLDARVFPTRDDFDIPDESSDILPDTPVGKNQILAAVTEHARHYLAVPLAALKTRREEMVRRYVATKNPALRAVVKYCPEVLDDLDPNASEERIDEVLYRKKGVAEFRVRQESDSLLKTQPKSLSEFAEQCRVISQKYDDFQKDNLSSYVTYRKFVIDLFRKKLDLRNDMKFENEEVLHDIIFPRKTDSDDIDFDHHNLWLIDDRLAFHEHAASDRELKKIMASGSLDRADIIAFSDVDTDNMVARTVSIVEFKKPQRENYQNETPPEQVLRIVQQVRSGKTTLSLRGRPIRIAENETQFLCYAICDFTTAVTEFAERADYSRMNGAYAYFNYNRNLNASIYLISLDQIPSDARKRNFAFFEKLGIGK